jgi:hypothetical protein
MKVGKIFESKVVTYFVDPKKHKGFSNLSEYVLHEFKARWKEMLEKGGIDIKFEMTHPEKEVIPKNTLRISFKNSHFNPSSCYSHSCDAGPNYSNIQLDLNDVRGIRDLSPTEWKKVEPIVDIFDKKDYTTTSPFSRRSENAVIHELQHMAQYLTGSSIIPYSQERILKYAQMFHDPGEPVYPDEMLAAYADVHSTVPMEHDAIQAEILGMIKSNVMDINVILRRSSAYYHQFDYKHFIKKATSYGITTSQLEKFKVAARKELEKRFLNLSDPTSISGKSGRYLFEVGKFFDVIEILYKFGIEVKPYVKKIRDTIVRHFPEKMERNMSTLPKTMEKYL